MTRILIATGGTGGHIYPALMTAEELRRRGCAVDFMGVFGASREKITGAGFASVELKASGFVSKGLGGKIRSVWSMAGALSRALAVIRREKFDVILGFGGYGSFPAVLAGIVCGVPSMLHEQNAFPGEANRLLGKCVKAVGVGFKDALKFFPADKAVWTGNPSRALDRAIPRDKAIAALGLDPARSTVLVFGGSQGSHALNMAMADVFADIPPGKAVQVIHLTGQADLNRIRERYAALGVGACVREYMDDMALAYAAADIVVGRAGAGTVTELGLLGLPAVLIPYPGARDHQKYNARVLERLGLASIIEEKLLRPDMLRDKIFAALWQGPSREHSFALKFKEEFVADGARRLCDELLRVAGVRGG